MRDEGAWTMRDKLNQVVIALSCVVAVLVCNYADAQTRRAKGWVREPPQVVATIPLIMRFRDYLPDQVDLSSRFPVPGDQGQQSSCTAWATGYAVRSYYEGQSRNWNFSSPGQIVSPSYLYNRVNNFSGVCNEGTSILDALTVLKNEGAPTLAAYPYAENDCARAPTPQIVKMGSAFRISGWSALDTKKLDDVKGQIYRGNPVVFGMEVSDTFESLRGREVYDDTSSARTGGHAMALVGYNEQRQAFKVMNSWGTDWADGGFGWISYRAIRQLSDRMFVMEVPTPLPIATQPDPVVVVPPAPAPAPVVVAPAPKPPPIVVAPAPPAPEPVVKPAPAPVIGPPEPPVVVAPPVPTPGPAPVVISPRPQPPQPVVTPPVAGVQARISARLNAVPCARIDGQIGADRVVRLRGFAGSADELATLRKDLSALPGVLRVEASVTLYPWPQCEVFLNFADALKDRRGLNVNLGAAAASVFAEGDSLSVQVVTPAFPSYLYVTYLQANGEAVNLSWPDGRFPKPYPPNSKITFGGGARGEPVYRISRPLGDEIIVVVASASPLFLNELPETATDREYLTSFRKSFLVQPQGGGGRRVVSAMAVPLRTQAK